MRSIATFLCITMLAAFTFCGCSDSDRYIAVTGFAQGGTYSVKMNLKGVHKAPEQIRESIDSILTLIDTTLSGYNKSSMLSRFNAGQDIVPNKLFIDIYDYCADMYEKTGTALDVASGPLFDIWGFGFKGEAFPTEEEVQSTLGACGMKRLSKRMEDAIENGSLSPISLVKDGSEVLPRLNYNAVAQGYSCDMVADYLHSLGVHDMLVDIGEIYCEGVNPSGQGWTIGVDRPVDGNDELGADLDGIWQSDGRGLGIVTSGNYRKFHIVDGKKYAHTVDPRTGYPVQHSLLSATIVAPTAADADALATYCMVIGLDEAKAFISAHEELEGYLIYDEDGQMREWASDGFNVITSKK